MYEIMENNDWLNDISYNQNVVNIILTKSFQRDLTGYKKCINQVLNTINSSENTESIICDLHNAISFCAKSIYEKVISIYIASNERYSLKRKVEEDEKRILAFIRYYENTGLTLSERCLGYNAFFEHDYCEPRNEFYSPTFSISEYKDDEWQYEYLFIANCLQHNNLLLDLFIEDEYSVYKRVFDQMNIFYNDLMKIVNPVMEARNKINDDDLLRNELIDEILKILNKEGDIND